MVQNRKNQSIKHQMDKVLYLRMIRLLTILSTQKNKAQQTITYTVVRKLHKKKRNDSFRDGIEIEEIHHHPENTQCDCCHHQMTEIGSTIAREEAKFIPAKMMRVQHIEHAYECKHCKKDAITKSTNKTWESTTTCHSTKHCRTYCFSKTYLR